MERRLWRMQDLREGGFGFSVEMFFLALAELLSTAKSTASSQDTRWESCREIDPMGEG